MRRWGLGIVLGAAVLSGCVADGEAGQWFDALHFGLVPTPPSDDALTERPLLAGSLSIFEGPLVDGLVVESETPEILRPMTALEASEGQLEEDVDPDATIGSDFEKETSHILLAAGEPGIATLTLRDPYTGQILDRTEVAVAASERSALVSSGPWREVNAIEPRILANTEYSLQPIHFGRDGYPLLGVRPSKTECRLPPSPPGRQMLDCGEIVVVSPDDIVGVELVEVADGALLALGIDREGSPVLGLPASWSDGVHPDAAAWIRDPARKENPTEPLGDLYRFSTEGPVVRDEVIARFGDLEASAFVHRSDAGWVTQSDAYNCSTTGSPAPLFPALLAPLLVIARRGRRATATE